jgi:hypothetical protein
MDKEFFNKNDKQVFFNQLRGQIHEIGIGDRYTNVVLIVGHDNTRFANFVIKTSLFHKLPSPVDLGDKVCIKYYISSISKNGKWYTSANILSIEKTF